MISENREFSGKKGAACVSVAGKKKSFCIQTVEMNLEGALLDSYSVFIIVADSRGKCHDLCR